MNFHLSNILGGIKVGRSNLSSISGLPNLNIGKLKKKTAFAGGSFPPSPEDLNEPEILQEVY